MSVHKYIVSKQTSNFTTIPNSVLQGLNYNLSALGLYCYLSSLPPLWEFHKEQLRKVCQVGINKLDELLNILSAHNLITITQVRDVSGRFSFFDMQVSDGSQFIPEKLSTGKKHRSMISTVRQKPWDGKQGPINTIDKNNINNIKKERERKKRASLSPFQPNAEATLLCKEKGLDPEAMVKKFVKLTNANGKHYKDHHAAFELFLDREYPVKTKAPIKEQATHYINTTQYLICKTCKAPEVACVCHVASQETSQAAVKKIMAQLKGVCRTGA
ncbi:MAG: hypothetical protein Q8936_14135 [Bacillota bacterium]|nr:hypothetical protein [Bacillota bacterium]